ncbi:tRNA (adenosine(37)-N6)-threonylcarbamoyltransferase complex transferase subunit TsaD [uncultured Mailhella sp.]|uniref:tRNA (adenosine(37)-N6)-threonylcarbamoyltransferase complex transferase subunit TsaD n=1 Tax=uncultured Mailhella sp. TaxID=1981031 RepID=UPI002629CE7B|nr:tRNA (adenosine(37)-N6)-threonylcarbamoyltransferase complex transferase subunit TsaD [uncultured Mailhella sp.]
MLVLGIESSCDETALALVDNSGVRASVISSQADIHALFGGVVPELASREHCRLIGPLLDSLLAQSGLGDDPWKHIDRIAVTRGPGLMGSLLVGVAFAKALSLAHGIPLIGVDHLLGHLLAVEMEEPVEFPALGVLISGGHTHLCRMDSPVDMIVLGRTIDDAAGEACDKFAKMAGLPYPGGALLDALGKRGHADPRLFPRPYTHNDNLDFSFSGLKTAGSLWLSQHPECRFPAGDTPARERLGLAGQELCDAAASYLLAVAETLSIKAERAMSLFSPRSIIVAGGVAANSVVRSVFRVLAEKRRLPLHIPSLSLCGDNAVMIARAGWRMAQAGRHHDLSLSAIPRGQVIPEDWTCGAAQAC